LLCHATSLNAHNPATDDSFLTVNHISSDYSTLYKLFQSSHGVFHIHLLQKPGANPLKVLSYRMDPSAAYSDASVPNQ
jgi:hypothetical protein